MRSWHVPTRWRPTVTGVLVAAAVMAAAINAAILDHYGRLRWSFPAELASALWRYGPVGLFDDSPIPPVSLRDGARKAY